MPVAPLAGAWVEINEQLTIDSPSESLPLRERGLKFNAGAANSAADGVAPLAGAWVEIV